MRKDASRSSALCRRTPAPILQRSRRRTRRRGLAVAAALAIGLLCTLQDGVPGALRDVPIVQPLSLFDAPCAAAGEEEEPAPLSHHYRRVARMEVPVEEISGWAPLPAPDDSRARRFLAVSDEGIYRVDGRRVEGALFEVEFRVTDDEAVSFVGARPVPIHLGSLIPRLDPAWARGHSIFDLEACVPLPGTRDLYLLTGERNPEDVTDGGANRLYVIRYPARGPREAPPSVPHSVPPSATAPEPGSATDGPGARLLGYVRVPDLADDAINDRFEAVVAIAESEPDAWLVFAFKERTEAPGRPPVYLPMRMRRTVSSEGSEEAFEVTSPHFQQYPLRLPALIGDRDRLGAQADACLGPRGNVWVLDRWRRELHLAEVRPPPALGLRHGGSFDINELIGDIPGERAPGEPAAPGGHHPGYGRQEAMCFDAEGWLWFAADLGGGRPSVVTVLAPRSDERDDDGAGGDGDGQEEGPGRDDGGR